MSQNNSFSRFFRYFDEINAIFDISQVAGKRETDQEVEAQQWIECVVGERFPPGNLCLLISLPAIEKLSVEA